MSDRTIFNTGFIYNEEVCDSLEEIFKNIENDSTREFGFEYERHIFSSINRMSYFIGFINSSYAGEDEYTFEEFIFSEIYKKIVFPLHIAVVYESDAKIYSILEPEDEELSD